MRSSTIYVAVVDDEECICRSFGRLLRAAGFQAITYPSAEALLGDLKHPRFDCLVLDTSLRGISGLELCDRLTAAGSVTPVIFITADDDPGAPALALASGCAGFFRKVDPANIILDAIRRAVDLRDTPPEESNGAGRAL